jgi:hypothetical protein
MEKRGEMRVRDDVSEFNRSKTPLPTAKGSWEKERESTIWRDVGRELDCQRADHLLFC